MNFKKAILSFSTQFMFPLFCFIFVGSISNAANYPVVTAIKGAVQKFDSKGNSVKVKEKERLYAGTKLVVGSNSKIVIELSQTTLLVLDSNTELDFPTVDLETGWVEKLNLAHGQVAIRCQENCGFIVQSEISQNSLTPGEFLFNYDKEIAVFKWSVLSGELQAKGLNQEEGITLKAKQKAFFQALIIESKVVFDELLKGKKVVRGQKPTEDKLSDEEVAAFNELFKLKKIIAQHKAKEIEKKKKKSVCEKPYGEFGQCLFRFQGLDCYKYTCDANGNWASPVPLSKEERKCRRSDIVGNCG